MVPAYAGLENVLLDLWTASQASSNAQASILIASGSNEGVRQCRGIGHISPARP